MHRVRPIPVAAMVALSLLLSASAVRGQSLNFSEQRFAPSPHAYDFLSVMSSHVPDTLDFNVGLLVNWAADTLIFEDRLGNRDHLLEGRLAGDLYASMSFFRYASLGLVLPINLYNTSGGTDAGFDGGSPIARGDIESLSLGDLRISPKIRILDAKESLVGLAVAVDIGVPTGTKDALATDDGVSVLPRLILDMNIKGYRAALNAGYKWRPERKLRWLTVDPEVFLSLAVGIPIAVPSIGLYKENLELIGEIETSARIEEFFGDGNTDHLEGRLALRYTTDFGLGVTVGGGGGFLSAYGSPSYRLFAGLNWTPRDINRDQDGDGLDDYVDLCPTEPEDFDGFQDEDGCPDPDNDGDGILDVDDQCPNEPEDFDGFQDEDGCPDPDNDGDGICDPWVAEKGMLERYAGICRGSDQCPDEPEDFDGCQDDDGCPEPGDVCVEKATKRIVVLQKVFFETDSARIKKVSYPILDEVAAVLKEHPEITRVEVQGHTDDVGDDRYNLRLSSGRAKSVLKYLVRAGVEAGRLTAKGYGETLPIDTNESEEGRSRNRRVEFIILD